MKLFYQMVVILNGSYSIFLSQFSTGPIQGDDDDIKIKESTAALLCESVNFGNRGYRLRKKLFSIRFVIAPLTFYPDVNSGKH